MSLQVYSGHKSGSKAAVHTKREIFKADETDKALLVDASNATNSLNRTAALHVPYDCYLCHQYLQSAFAIISDQRE